MGNIVLESLGNQCSNQYNHIKNSMYLCTTTLKIWSLWLLFTWVRSRLLWPTLAEDMVLSSSGSLPENHRNSRDGPILLYVPVTQWGKLLNTKLSILTVTYISNGSSIFWRTLLFSTKYWNFDYLKYFLSSRVSVFSNVEH